jgi:photosystem II stability/assembly factor-like uncharacterized protein
MLKYIRNIGILCMMIFMGSCHKNEITLLTHQVATNTSYELNSIYFTDNNTGYICGGSRFAIGVVIRTTDGGKTWSASDSVLGNALYTMTFFSAQEALLGGFYGSLAYTDDSARTFSIRKLDPDQQVQHLSFYDRQHGVAACGLGYQRGEVYNTLNGGSNWTLAYSDSLHSFIGSEYIDDTTIVVCGYGTVLRSHDSGTSYTVVKENGDFYQNVVFIGSIGYAVGYQGEIIKSTDRGLTWNAVRSGNGFFSTPTHLIGVDFIDENNGYAVGESGLMIHTGDGGMSWQTVKPFTASRLRAVHMFTSTTGIVAGENGNVFLFQR